MENAEHPLKQFRESRGLSRAKLGELLGVSRVAVFRWEKEDRFPDIGLKTRIEEVTDGAVTYADLVDYKFRSPA